MSLEDQYDAWVRGLMGGGKYAATPKQAEDANDAVQQMQAQLDALTEAQKRQTAAGSALNAVQKAGAATAESVRRMSSELTKSLKQDGLLGGTVAAPSPAPAVPAKADFAGVTEKIKAQVLGQDAFVSALVKAFRRPFVLGTADDTAHARSVMLLCGPNGTGRHYALQCVVDELAARGVLHSAAVETLDLALYPGPAQEKLFLQDLYAALQSDAEVLTFEHYESCAANYLNMLATLAMDGTLALSSRYVLQRGILVDVGTALAPGAIGELQAGGKYFVFYSNKGETALADHFGAKFVDAVAGDICRTEAFTPEALAAVAARELNYLAQRTRRQCGLALTMGADVRDLLASQYGKTSGMQAMRDYCETVYRAIAEYVLDADETPADGTPAALTAENGRLCMAVNGGDSFDLLALLPQQYRGDVDAVEAELDGIIGLDEIKSYVRDIAKNVQAQQRRKAQGLKVAEVNMHMIFTGNPGTGKTTTVNAILSLYEALYDRVALCAPTGRAAKRLSELTNHAASTIHRLLEVDYSSGSVRFIHNEKNLLKYDVIILDEMSMVDVKLFQALLAAARYHCRIIMVGDADQLPSVGPGNILGEILKAGVVPTVRLTDIFRQAQRSLIVQNAHRIVEGQMPQKGGPKDDFFLIESNGLACQKLVCDLVSTRLPKAYGFDPVRDIQVLCPTKVGPTGSVELNRRLQDILNPPAKGKGQIGTAESAKILRLGDKVMQIKNDYDITFERAGAEAGVGAYNGDLGIITAVDVDARSVTVQMDDKKYTYTADQLNELEPAYAVTVHKSQGSEFPAVILPVADVPARLCYRNLLYTGVTRARKLCVLTGTARTEQTMVENVRQNMRYSGLRYLLKDAATPTEEKQEQLSAT